MKIRRYLLYVLFFAIILMPSSSLAKTKEEALAQLEQLAIENSDGSCSWDVKMIDPKVMAENYCNFTKNEIYEMYPYVKNYNDDELTDYIKNVIKGCKEATINSIIENASRKKGFNNWEVAVYDLNFETFDPNSVVLSTLYNTELNNNYELATKTCKIEYVEYEEKELKDAKNIVKKLNSNNTIYSLNSFNSIYHYGPIFQNNRIASDMILYKFPEFKQILMEHPEYEYEIAWQGGGGTPIETGCSGYIFAYKNGIPYGMKSVGFTIDNRLYVDKDAEGTLIERATARLNEYFKNSIKIEFNLEVMEENLEIDGMTGLFTEIKLGEYSTQIFILEVDKKELDKFEAKAHHKKYDINVITSSYDVPLDMTLDVEEVTDKLEINNKEHNILNAYDINVIKTGNKTLIKKIEDGIEVYIPVQNKKINDKMKVFHIVDNKELQEEFEGIVVELDGKMYVKFITTHFSTYAVADTLNADVDVSDQIISPNTGDTIGYSITLLLISLCTLCFVAKANKKLIKR